MKFKCGPTYAEKQAVKEEWHPHFLLWPKRIGDECYWLQYVERRGFMESDWDEAWWEWEYRIREE